MKVYTFQGLMKSATKVYIRTDPIYLQYDLLQLGYATPPRNFQNPLIPEYSLHHIREPAKEILRNDYTLSITEPTMM